MSPTRLHTSTRNRILARQRGPAKAALIFKCLFHFGVFAFFCRLSLASLQAQLTRTCAAGALRPAASVRQVEELSVTFSRSRFSCQSRRRSRCSPRLILSWCSELRLSFPGVASRLLLPPLSCSPASEFPPDSVPETSRLDLSVAEQCADLCALLPQRCVSRFSERWRWRMSQASLSSPS